MTILDELRRQYAAERARDPVGLPRTVKAGGWHSKPQPQERLPAGLLAAMATGAWVAQWWFLEITKEFAQQWHTHGACDYVAVVGLEGVVEVETRSGIYFVGPGKVTVLASDAEHRGLPSEGAAAVFNLRKSH
jgi:hypothetical protein